LRAHSAAKCDCGQGSAPDPAGGAPPDLLAGFKGAASRWEGSGGGGKRKRKTGRKEKEREGEVDSDAQLEHGR